MERLGEPTWLDLSEHSPCVAEDAWVAPNATLVGAVSIGAQASIWYFTVARGDGDRIDVGAGSNIQDGCVLHADPGIPIWIGQGVSVGHRAVLHGCVISDNVLVGMGAVLMNGVHVGEGSIIGAGTVLLEDTHVPAGSLVAGVPGRVRRTLAKEERHAIQRNASTYVSLMKQHRGAWRA